MESIVFFSTCPVVANELEGKIPAGITLRRLQPFNSEVEPFNFSQIHFVANIDLTKISTMDATNYLLSECSDAKGRHYFELNGRRFSTYDTESIKVEAEKIAWRQLVKA